MRGNWYPYYAWFPTKLDYGGKWAWFRTIERRQVWVDVGMVMISYYRAPKLDDKST